jgi:hypothetical protein
VNLDSEKIIPKIYSKTHNLVNRHIAEKSVLTKSVLDKSAKFFTPKICFGTKYQKWIFGKVTSGVWG